MSHITDVADDLEMAHLHRAQQGHGVVMCATQDDAPKPGSLDDGALALATGKSWTSADLSSLLAAKVERLVVVEDYSQPRGGATTLALLSVRLIRSLGIPVTYICGDHGDNAELRELDVEVVPLKARDLLHASRISAMRDGVHNLGAARLLSNWISNNDTPATIYHVHGWSKILSPAVFHSLKKVAHRCVVHAHDFFTACPNGAYFDYQAQRVCSERPLSISCAATACDKRNYLHKLWRLARGANVARLLAAQNEFSTMILLHDKMRPYLLRAGYAPERLITISNPVAFPPSDRVQAENNQEFFFVGRLDEEKGIQDALAAVKRAGVKLCVIGDGPLMAKVEAAGPSVRALGWLSHAQIAAALRQASALIMPSRYPEPLGLVAVEAARSGVPVILNKEAFIADQMVAIGIGFACDTSDEAAFADLLRRVNDMPRDQMHEMSKRATESWSSLALTDIQWRDALTAVYLKQVEAPVHLRDHQLNQGARS